MFFNILILYLYYCRSNNYEYSYENSLVKRLYCKTLIFKILNQL